MYRIQDADQMLVVFLESNVEFDDLEPTNPTRIFTKDVREIRAFPQILHHLVKGRTFLADASRLPHVRVFADDFDAIFGCPRSYVSLL